MYHTKLFIQENKLRNIIVFMVSALLFSGCAIKQEDSTATKVAKHTVNAPGYAFMGLGYVATKTVEAVAIGTLVVVTAPVVVAKELAKDTTNTNQTTEEKVENAESSTTDIKVPVEESPEQKPAI